VAFAGPGDGPVSLPSPDLVAAKKEAIRLAVSRNRLATEAAQALCGNGVLEGSETCDDGNPSPGDGCSASCQVELGWECTPPATTNAVSDGGFEQGSPNPDWTEAGIVSTPLCDVTCGGPPAYEGDWYAWFGGLAEPDTQTLDQVLTIPANAVTLEFRLFVGACDSPDDILTVEIDGNPEFSSSPCTITTGYESRTLDLVAGGYNDGGSHTLRFRSDTFATNGAHSNYFVDDVRISVPETPPVPSSCSLAGQMCFQEDFESGLGGWTTFQTGVNAAAWGTSDDGLCGSVNWVAANYTDGAGVAACIDSDAAGPGQIDSYLCSPVLDLSAVAGVALDFRYNYQIFGNPDAGDFFEVLMGTIAPEAGTIGTYAPVFSRSTSAGALVGAGASESLSLATFEGESEAWICYRYGANFDWYGQLDEVRLHAGTCDGTNLPEETSPPGAPEPLVVVPASAGDGGRQAEATELHVSWGFTPGAASYRIISGDVSSLAPGGVTAANASPIACGIVGLSTDLPMPAGSVFLLAVGESAAGLGPLGDASDGTPRSAATSCP
jgi:cysteine-rich repeat protein